MSTTTANGQQHKPDREHAANDGFAQVKTSRSLPYTLLRARVAVMDNFTKFLADRNKTEQQWRVLRLLGLEETMDATRLAERACILAPSLTRIIKTLSAEGLILSRRDPADGRRIKLSISDAGTALLHDSLRESEKIYGFIIDTFGQEETEKLLDLLEGLEQALIKAETEKV